MEGDLAARHTATETHHRFIFDSWPWSNAEMRGKIDVFYDEIGPRNAVVQTRKQLLGTFAIESLLGTQWEIAIPKSRLGLNYDRKLLFATPTDLEDQRSFARVAVGEITIDRVYDCPDSALFTSDPHGDLITFKRTMLLSGLFQESGDFVKWKKNKRGCFIITGDIFDRGNQDEDLWQKLMTLKRDVGTGQKLIITLGRSA